MKNLVFSIFVLLTIGLISCKTQSKQDTAAEGNSDNAPVGSASAPVDFQCTLNDFDYTNSGLGGEQSFPFVYQGTGRSHVFEAYNLRFQLTAQPPLLGMINEQVPWLQPDNFTELNGNFMTYVRNGRKLSLENPYIQVQYISKKVPNFSSIDSAFTWVDDLLVTQLNGEVLKEEYEVKTQGGLVARLKEYKYGDFQGRRGKNLAYAYIDVNEDYIIGFVLTSVIDTDFPINIPLFRTLVESYCS